MPRTAGILTPKYRKHRASGRAVLTIAGRDCYLGPIGTKASKLEYDRLIAEWMSNGRQSLKADDGLTIAELIQRYRKHAESYYRGADGKQTCEVEDVRKACRVLRNLYGDTLAKDFGPLALQAVRGVFIDKGYCRTSINRDIGRLKLMFKWATAQDLECLDLPFIDVSPGELGQSVSVVREWSPGVHCGVPDRIGDFTFELDGIWNVASVKLLGNIAQDSITAIGRGVSCDELTVAEIVVWANMSLGD